MTGWVRVGLESWEEGKIRNRKFLLMGKRVDMRQEEDSGSKSLLNVTAPLPLPGGGHCGELKSSFNRNGKTASLMFHYTTVGYGGVTETFSPC